MKPKRTPSRRTRSFSLTTQNLNWLAIHAKSIRRTPNWVVNELVSVARKSASVPTA